MSVHLLFRFSRGWRWHKEQRLWMTKEGIPTGMGMAGGNIGFGGIGMGAINMAGMGGMGQHQNHQGLQNHQGHQNHQNHQGHHQTHQSVKGGEHGPFVCWDTDAWARDVREMTVLFADLEERGPAGVFPPGMTLVVPGQGQGQAQGQGQGQNVAGVNGAQNGSQGVGAQGPGQGQGGLQGPGATGRAFQGAGIAAM
jgi:hypothetical protein